MALAASLYYPRTLGLLGENLRFYLVRFLGWPAYGLPFFLTWGAIRSWRERRQRKAALAYYYCCAFLPLFGFMVFLLIWAAVVFEDEHLAGLVGRGFIESFKLRVGWFGVAVLLSVFFGVWTRLAFGVRWLDLIGRAARLLLEDWRQWRQALKALPKTAPAPEACEATVEETFGLAKAKAEKSHPSYAQKVVRQNVLPQQELSEPAAASGCGTWGPGGTEPAASRGRGTLGAGGAEPAAPALEAIPLVSQKMDCVAWQLPSTDLLLPAEHPAAALTDKDLFYKRGHDLVHALANFDVDVALGGVVPGPVVTRYDLVPQPGVKVGEISSLDRDIALAMRVAAVRIIGPIAGKGAIGIEVPNPSPRLVKLREVVEDPKFVHGDGALVFALGRAASGEAICCDLVDMPHLLVAGATNSGKSVLVHALVASLLFRMTPDELKLVLIDPKRLELPLYDGIPHLFDPRKSADEARVITDAKEAAKTLNALTDLMDYRYDLLAACGVRHIDAYNEAIRKKRDESGPDKTAPLPYMVVIIDELADLMLIAGKEVEDDIQRLAQMARAVGIHLVLATQRPSVDVITGVIKANLPARIALQVVSKVDSRVILDSLGAEDLLGAGDMLYLASGAPRPVRLQGAYVSDEEIGRVVSFWKAQGGPSYRSPQEFFGGSLSAQKKMQDDSREDQENLRRALDLVLERRRVSQDLLKAHFGSSAKATDLLSRLEVGGFITKPEGTNRWEIRYDRIEDYLKQ